MTLTELRNKANAKLTDMWPVIQAKEDTYFAKHGKYFQLLAGSNLTLDGADTSFSVVSPSDEAHTIDIDYAWSDTVPFKIEIHEWVGPSGDVGYKSIVTVNHEGTFYQRSRTSTDVDSGWNVYNPNV